MFIAIKVWDEHRRGKDAVEREEQMTRLIDSQRQTTHDKWEPILKKSDGAVLKFVLEHSESSAVICMAYILRDKEFLIPYQGKFAEDPAFALHYINAFPDDPDINKWIKVLLKNDPENAIGHYLDVVHQIQQNPGMVSPVIDHLKDTVTLTEFDDYSVAIESAAMTFFTDYLDMVDYRDALRLSTWQYSFTPSLGGFAEIHDFINENLSNATPQERIHMGAAGFNIGTNLVATGDPLSMAIGLGLEGLYYRVLSDSTEETFNVSPGDVLTQIDDDRALMQMMIKADPPDFKDISDSDLKKFQEVRQKEGRIPSFLFLEKLRQPSPQ